MAVMKKERGADAVSVSAVTYSQRMSEGTTFSLWMMYTVWIERYFLSSMTMPEEVIVKII